MSCYRFADFALSPRRRILIRGGRELRLIPRYFDLLVFLVAHRHEAVHRRDIFDSVWSDVVVSDSALSQAIRTLRRTLGDDSQEPRFIRTVSRHGYRFVFADVIEEDDDASWPAMDPDAPRANRVGGSVEDPFEPLLRQLTSRASSLDEEEQQRDAAERLHALGTAEALRRLRTRPRHEYGRALLRDTRSASPEASQVPILGQPGAIGVSVALARLRLRRVARIAAARAVQASIGAGVAGTLGGTIGGLMLAAAPGSQAPLAVVGVLAAIGACCGTLGGGGVAAGLSLGEATIQSQRTMAVAAGAAIGGGIVGSIAQWLGRWSLATVVGVRVPIGGGLEGLVLGGAAGVGYALATRRATDGLAAPRGRERLSATAATALACALGALALTAAGRPLVGGTVHAVAQASAGSQAMLTPLGRLIGEPDFGPLTRAFIGTGEGGVFGLGLAIGLTKRPRLPR